MTISETKPPIEEDVIERRSQVPDPRADPPTLPPPPVLSLEEEIDVDVFTLGGQLEGAEDECTKLKSALAEVSATATALAAELHEVRLELAQERDGHEKALDQLGMQAAQATGRIELEA